MAFVRSALVKVLRGWSFPVWVLIMVIRPPMANLKAPAPV